MAVRKTFTPELTANGRRRYEETDEPLPSIAADFGVNVRTMRKYVQQWNWAPRSERPPHGMSLLASLCEQSKDIPAPKPPVTAAAVQCADADVANADIAQLAPSSEPIPVTDDAWAERRAAMIERLWNAVETEVDAVERLRAQLGTQVQSPADVEKTARALESIMRTLKEVDRLRFVHAASAATGNDDDYDDMPRDLDEFRRALAERIEAFVASRPDDDVVETGPAAEEFSRARE